MEKKTLRDIVFGEARAMFKFWSVRLAALFGLIVAYFMSDPTLLPRLVHLIPEDARPFASGLVGFVAFALPYIARRLPQPNLEKPEQE